MTVLTLKITKPKTSVHLNPSLDDVREIQVIDFVRVRKPFVIKQNMPQHIFKVEDDGSETELFRFNIANACPIEEMQGLIKNLDKRFFIIEVDGDFYIKSRDKLRFTKGIYTELGVSEIIEKGKPCPLLWNNSDGQRFLVQCDIVEKLSSYDNITGSGRISTPSKLLAVVPSQHYPVLRMKSHQQTCISVGVVRSVVEIKCDVEVVNDFQFRLYGDVESVVLEVSSDTRLDTSKISTTKRTTPTESLTASRYISTQSLTIRLAQSSIYLTPSTVEYLTPPATKMNSTKPR